MGFAHAQATVFNNTSTVGATTLALTLASNPAPGDVVCIGLIWFDSTTTPPASISVADSNSNSYTKSPNSPVSVNGTTTGIAYVFYLNNAPANATKTITITFTAFHAAGIVEGMADDFTVSGGTSAFDNDAVGNGNGLTINTPTVTPSGSNELLYGFAAPESGVGSVNSPWTLGAIDSAVGQATCYILSASAATAFNMTNTNHWSSIGLAFSIGGSGPTTDQLVAATNQTEVPRFDRRGLMLYRRDLGFARRDRIFVPRRFAFA